MQGFVRAVVAVVALLALSVPARADRWIASWTGSAQGPYPAGNATAQPELRFAFPSPELGARDQSFRLVVRPDVWGGQTRIRLSNVFGTRPVTFDNVFVGLQHSGAAIVEGTNVAAQFGGKSSITIPAGESVVSDLTAPGDGSRSSEIAETGFPFSTTSWYFLDEVDMSVADRTQLIVAFGDSITDGTGTTINGDDRWPDVLSRRLHARFGDDYVIVNQGIGGNQVAGPSDYSPDKPFAGGPSAISRLDRDVISLPGVAAVIWMEGINDFGAADAAVETVENGYSNGVARLRERIPGVTIVAATLTSALHSIIATHGRVEVDAKRKALNEFLRTSKIFDGVVDFDAATFDAATGEIKSAMQPNSSTGGPGDKLHPNRAGYAAMGNAIELEMITPRKGK
ncbi:GDSL-type esterase/lipase family protein [Bradyrhizobium sp. CCGUVB23]|uniref:GDSL-type esterase/lipase family protein n=1 Tax=Bradyrhizobium sp. CCGUVB23 TaxID=2949630 RepID=UPI0020B344D9|nr:GDSL-type esterase/lipase family protein [Bradyrhizobium sp. CCGUVB23]MCP3466549.1 GDSL-type esterase/lipase family protein [Bradyrhizobium sp. CCGUVB23]